MADLFYIPFDFEICLEASFAAVDAEVSAQAFVSRDSGVSMGREEIVPDRVVGYRIISEQGATQCGVCGWIIVQYVEATRTLLAFKVALPGDSDFTSYASFYSIPVPGNTYELSIEELVAIQKIRFSEMLAATRQRILREVCELVSRRFTNVGRPVAPSLSPKSNRPKKAGGRPGLPDDEMVRRLALVLLERRLKQKDPGFTRGEFVFRIHQKLEFPVEMHTIKNAAKLLEQAQKDDQQHMLSQAETLAMDWQQQLE